MDPPKLNKDQLTRLPDSRKHSLVFDWLTKVTDFLRESNNTQIRAAQDGLIHELEILLACNAAPPVRRIAARAMASLFSKGNPYGAYQIINKCNDLLKVKDDSKEHTGQRLFALEVIATLYSELGRLLGSCFPDTVFSLLKCLRLSESSRSECLDAIRHLLIGLEGSASMKHAEIYKSIRPFMTSNDSSVRSSAALCVGQLALQFSQLVIQSEVEGLFQLALRQMNEPKSRESFSIMMANVSLAVLDSSIQVPNGNSKLRKPSRDELLNYLKLSFVTGQCVQKREIFKSDVSSLSVKAGVAHCHVHLVRGLGTSWLESNLTLFLNHLLNIATEPKTTQTHQDALYSCRQIKTILSQTIDQLLSEKAQLQAIKILGQFIHQHRPENDIQTGHALVIAIQAITSLTHILQSSAYPSLSDSTVTNGLMSVLCHELPSARLCAAWCLRQVILSQPSLLTEILEKVCKRLTDFRSSKTAVEGHSAAISAILSATGMTPHTAIVDGTAKRILSIAGELLKPTKDKTSYLARSKLLAAWFIYSGIMSLPTVDLTQNVTSAIISAINDTFPKGDIKGAYLKELSLPMESIRLLIEARSGALRTIEILAREHEELLDSAPKVFERTLRAALEFLAHTTKMIQKYGPSIRPVIQFYKMVLYVTLAQLPKDLWEHGLPDLFKQLVADMTLTDTTDNAITSLLQILVEKDDLDVLVEQDEFLTQLLPLGCLQHSASEIITKKTEMPEPFPLHNQLLNAAVALFGIAFPSSAIKHRAQIAQHFISCLQQVRKDRAFFLQVNILTAYGLALKELSRLKGTVGDEVVLKSTAELLLSFVSHSSATVRCVASGGLGRLAQLHPQLINNLAQISFEKIKEPKSTDCSKSGFCLVLGDLHRYVGTRAKSSHIRTTGSILLSLASDSRLGIVQCWATFALYLVVDAVGPNFTSFIEPTLDCVLDQLLASSQTPQAVKCLSRLLQSLITVAGPELAMDQNLLGIVNATLAVLESTTAVQEAISCIQRLQMFVPEQDNLPRILPRLCEYLRDSCPQLQSVAVGCLRQLSQRNPSAVSILGEQEFPKGIEEKLFDLFDVPDGIQLNEVRDTLNLLLSARFEEKTEFWMTLVREVFQASHAAEDSDRPVIGDDDSESEDDEESMTTNDAEKKVKPHWRTRVFAAEVLSNIMEHCADSKLEGHFDLKVAQANNRAGRQQYLVTHLSDLIRCFFIAATDSNTQLSIVGLESLERLIELFKYAEDPDVERAFLLEQYQANISAALRPAFASDALPHVAVCASRVAAKWLSCGVASSINDIQRVYRLMVSSLDSIRFPSKASNYSPVLMKMKENAMIEAWAEIYIAAVEQSKEKKENRHKEIPPEGMLNLIESEMKDLRNLWNAVLSDGVLSQGTESILHANALLTNNMDYWKGDDGEHKTMVHIIAGYAVEALLRPPSSISERTCLHYISALNELPDTSDIFSQPILTRELVCVAHRVLVTRNFDSAINRQIGFTALRLALKVCLALPTDQRSNCDDDSVLMSFLEVVSCSVSKIDFTNPSNSEITVTVVNLISSLPSIVEDGARQRLLTILSYCVGKIISQVVRDNKNDHRELVGAALCKIKLLFDVNLILPIILEYLKIPTKEQNIITATTISTFFIINYNLSTSTMVTMLEIFVHALQYESLHKHVCSISTSCMKYISNDIKKVIMNVFGKHVAKLLWENKLADAAIPDAVTIFTSYSMCDETAQIVYLRLLLNLLAKRVHSTFILQQFTNAAAIYALSAKRILITDTSLKIMLEQRILEQASIEAVSSKPSESVGPKIALKMNFANYTN